MAFEKAELLREELDKWSSAASSSSAPVLEACIGSNVSVRFATPDDIRGWRRDLENTSHWIKVSCLLLMISLLLSPISCHHLSPHVSSPTSPSPSPPSDAPTQNLTKIYPFDAFVAVKLQEEKTKKARKQEARQAELASTREELGTTVAALQTAEQKREEETSRADIEAEARRKVEEKYEGVLR